ncbi:hypothetical protein BJV74DRAFT_888445 [Russula compacta]|nr:hypothetical protein BJV74DRAFT_888445 [Russula compacta]
MKHQSSDEEVQSRSDASSRGMGNVADSEVEVEPIGVPGAADTQQNTHAHDPHQSAVLHALLAQSRFPTTAMREEVGRSIGLSARKVQVWFQASRNQRQKARRPRNQGSAPPARPPQYGAFPNASAHPSALSTLIPSSLSSDEVRQHSFYAAPSAPFIQFNVNWEYPSRETFGPSTATVAAPSPGGHLSGPGVPGASTSSFAPRFLPGSQTMPPPLAEPPPQPRDVHPSARQVPSRDFTFNHPFPLLQVPEAGGGASSSHFVDQNPSYLPPHFHHHHHHHHPGPGVPRSQHQHQQQPTPFTSSESRPQTPGTFLVPHRRLESVRDLPRLQIPPPLHVPESPHGQQQQQQQQQQPQQRSALPVPRYSPLSHDPLRFSQPSERALLSTTTSGSSHGENSPAPLRARRFDPVREAASERSGSQGTDTSSTPPRIDTPHV